jgi:hypothetical protein
MPVSMHASLQNLKDSTTVLPVQIRVLHVYHGFLSKPVQIEQGCGDERCTEQAVRLATEPS